MHDGTSVLAGDCTTVFDGSREREHRGDVVVIVKPDNTVLVHDAEGYQPVAWLTRADSVAIEPTSVVAADGNEVLRVVTHEEHGRARYPVSTAGVPIGDCPACAGTLVQTSANVSCTDCDASYGIPTDADVTSSRCQDCGLPTFRVERGQAFELCLDRDCDSLDDRVRDAFDREWSCPDCDSDLRILRRGGLLVGCAAYPDCEVGYSLPNGVVVGECGCGLPRFETASGRRCLDANCEVGAATE
jgi:DNA topoisomerase-1